MKNKRIEQKEQTRQHLLNTAYEVFAKKGILAAKASDIAQEAAVANGTVFLHFPTKEELLTQVIEEFGITIGNKFKELADHEYGVRDILQAHLAIIQEYELFYGQLIKNSTSLPAAVRNQVFMIQSGIAHYLKRAVEYELQRNTIKQMPLPLMLNTWLGLLHYYLINKDMFSPHGSAIERYGEILINFFMSCITK